jgi:hypothetical protein
MSFNPLNVFAWAKLVRQHYGSINAFPGEETVRLRLAEVESNAMHVASTFPQCYGDVLTIRRELQDWLKHRGLIK